MLPLPAIHQTHVHVPLSTPVRHTVLFSCSCSLLLRLDSIITQTTHSKMHVSHMYTSKVVIVIVRHLDDPNVLTTPCVSLRCKRMGLWDQNLTDAMRNCCQPQVIKTRQLSLFSPSAPNAPLSFVGEVSFYGETHMRVNWGLWLTAPWV